MIILSDQVNQVDFSKQEIIMGPLRRHQIFELCEKRYSYFESITIILLTLSSLICIQQGIKSKWLLIIAITLITVIYSNIIHNKRNAAFIQASKLKKLQLNEQTIIPIINKNTIDRNILFIIIGCTVLIYTFIAWFGQNTKTATTIDTAEAGESL